MRKSIITIASLMAVVLAGSVMFMDKKEVKADAVPKVEEATSKN